PICGMNLVKQELKSTNLNQQANKDSVNQTITIRPEIIQRMGIRTTKVKRQVLQKIIKTVGYVTYNEDKMIHIHARSNGWVENLAVRREGDWVKRGQKLLEMYSHEILEAQQDFLVALRTTIKGTNLNRKEYRNSIRNRLRLLGIPDSTIKKIERKNTFINNIPIFAPQSGVITRFNIREGMYVTPGLEIFTIVDLSDIWIIAEVFEHQLAWVEKGLSAEITIPALPSKIFKGKIEFIYPELGIKTRTLKVRLGFNNPNGILKLNMFAQAVIHGKPKKNVLTIPQQALIVTGERKTVIRALSEGRFEPVEVKTGMRSQAKVEILSGLKVNDDIVLSGQFLIDSEANLQASFLRFSAVGKTEPLEHHH
ncbi:MAG: efflux RND transporter periplasmic adaptor subunit, partial [Thiomargarita sp.]|nr:efflux RND transporter periplasmic adaptor subunit [Thiomargarita sp.]